MKSMAVYCGHEFGTNPRFAADAAELGKLMAKNKIRLVFGGGGVGIMGTVASSVRDAGGNVIGVSTRHVMEKQEPIIDGIKSRVVRGVNDRKQKMYDLSNAFCILPGGMGTLNELTDILTMQQIGESRKPIYFLNTGGYWDIFSRVMAHMDKNGFIEDLSDYNMKIFDSPNDIIKQFLHDHE